MKSFSLQKPVDKRPLPWLAITTFSSGFFLQLMEFFHWGHALMMGPGAWLLTLYSGLLLGFFLSQRQQMFLAMSTLVALLVIVVSIFLPVVWQAPLVFLAMQHFLRVFFFQRPPQLFWRDLASALVLFLLPSIAMPLSVLFIMAEVAMHWQHWPRKMPMMRTLTVSMVSAWLLSTAGLLVPQVLSLGVCCHDVLLSLGIFMLGEFCRSAYRSQLSSQSQVAVWVNGRVVPLESLRKGQVFTVDKALTSPMPVEARVGSRIRQDECVKHISEAERFDRGVELLSGEFAVEEAYVRPVRRQMAMLNERFTAVIVYVAVLVGLGLGYWHGSLLLGLRQFSLMMLAACPCCFLVARPLVEQMMAKYLRDQSYAVYDLDFLQGDFQTVVFDRTHTLCVEDLNNPEGLFQLRKGAKAMLQRLQAQGKKLVILSGHADEGHMQAMRHQLNGLTIEMVYGDVYKEAVNKQRWLRDYCQEHAGERVFYVGDGQNDTMAMADAHGSLAMGGYEPVHSQAHLAVTAQAMPPVDQLLRDAAIFSGFLQRLNVEALLYNLLMVFLVSGGYHWLTGVVMPLHVACLAMMAFSLFQLMRTSLWGRQWLPRAQTGGQKALSSQSIGSCCASQMTGYQKESELFLSSDRNLLTSRVG